MAVAAPLVLADALATPVNHTFVPLGPDANNVWWFEDQSALSAIGNYKASVSLVRPGNASRGQSSADRTARVKLSLLMPGLETISNNDAGLLASPTVAFVEAFKCEFTLPERAVLQNRKDLRKMAAGLLGLQPVIDAVENLIGIY